MRRLSRKKSKRMSLRKKHTVVREAAEAKRKLRKEARRMARIPNSCPNKKQLLQDLEDQRKIESEHRREVQKRAREQRNSEEFEKLTSSKQDQPLKSSLEAMISMSDIIIEVLDSQDPAPSAIVESMIGSKEHIFVINKIDLVPETVSSGWQSFLASKSITFLFKSPATDALRQPILEVIEDYPKVAVVGFPNVGKSSFINAFKGFKVANVGKLPGMTKKIEEFVVEKWTFIDGPGLEHDEKTPVGALRTVRNIESLSDPYTPVMGILEKVPKEKLLVLYAIPDFTSIQEFLTHVAKKLGKVAKGGVPDFDSASKMILHDWFTHRIPHMTLNP
jgi:nuclear GTP-binding protein